MYRQQYPDDPGMHNSYGNYGNNSHSRTTYRRNETFCERVQKSLFGIIVGLVLILVAGGLLFWNEGRAVQTAQSLDEGLNIIVPLTTTDVAFDMNNGKLVHLSGELSTDKVLSDPDYGVSLHVVKLKRIVEMYQWVEHETKREYDEGGHTRTETTYDYYLEWKPELIHSSSFDNPVGHQNPKSMPVQSKEQIADDVKVGNFHLSESLKQQITKYNSLSIEHINIPDKQGVDIYMGYIYYSNNPSQPQVGDVRISFEYSGISGASSLGQPDQVSVIARQSGIHLTRYETEAGDDLEILYPGVVSAKKIFEMKQNENAMMTWAIRFGGWLLMFVGFGCLTSIVTTLVDWLPIVRDLVAMGMGAMNAALSISLSITVIAIGWIRYRPLLGISLLVLSLVPFMLSKFRTSRRQATSYHRDVYS